MFNRPGFFRVKHNAELGCYTLTSDRLSRPITVQTTKQVARMIVTLRWPLISTNDEEDVVLKLSRHIDIRSDLGEFEYSDRSLEAFGIYLEN